MKLSSVQDVNNPQREDGHLEINNVSVSDFCKLHLSGNEWQILWVVLKKTWGFNKKEDLISLTQFQKLTNLSRPSVSESIVKLVGKKVLLVNKNKKINLYSFNKHSNQWLNSTEKSTMARVVRKSVSNSTEKSTMIVPKRVHTINTITKDNIQKTHTERKKTFFSSLTEEQSNKIIADLGITKEVLEEYSSQADEWSNGKGNKMLDWGLTIRGWIRRDLKAGKITNKQTSNWGGTFKL